MLRTKALISSILEVPREWVFEFYLELGERLTGQDIKMKSVFNSNEKNPSFFVYYSTTGRKYMFKDFSTDKQGDGTTLVKEMFNLTTRGEAAHKIIEDYNKFVLTNKEDYALREFKIRQKYKVAKFTPRNWNKLDEKYWMRYRIGSKLLTHYNVQPLEDYTMRKEEDGEVKELTIRGSRIYGYFRADGTLYKIYQPMTKDNKFIKVVDYIQGTDQLTYKAPYLVICSSLKDIMAFDKMKFKNAEVVAPDSENTLIPEHVMKSYELKYDKICTLFDNDEAGIKSMEKYKEKYGIPAVYLNLEKDLADCIEAHGVNNTRIQLYPVLTKALTGKAKKL